MMNLQTLVKNAFPAPAILTLVLAITGLAFTPPAHAQVEPGASRNVNPMLDPTPLDIESLNLRFNPPKGSNTVAENLNGQIVVTLSDSPKSPTWTMRLQTMKSSLPKPTAAGQIDDLLKELDRAKTPYRVVANEAHTAGGLTGQMCYLERTTKDGQSVVTGWLVLPIAPTEFMVFAMQTVPDNFNLMRSVWESCFATLDMRTQAQVAESRNARVQNGQELLATMTPERLRSLVGQKQWTRISKPGATGTGGTEIGCALIEILAAKRGSLNPAKDETKYNATEREDGLLVRVQGRYIVDATRKVFYDSIALYWMAWDQSDEAWSVRGTQRQGEAEISEAETGLRSAASTGQPRPTLTVVKSTGTTEPVSSEWEVPDVYLSQALGWIVGRLMPRDATEPKEYGWYFYVTSSMKPKVYQRVDKWERTSEGNFTLTTYLTPETPPFTTTYDSKGNLIRRVHGDGSITEPIDITELRKIWKAKGLPVTAAGQ